MYWLRDYFTTIFPVSFFSFFLWKKFYLAYILCFAMMNVFIFSTTVSWHWCLFHPFITEILIIRIARVTCWCFSPPTFIVLFWRSRSRTIWCLFIDFFYFFKGEYNMIDSFYFEVWLEGKCWIVFALRSCRIEVIHL